MAEHDLAGGVIWPGGEPPDVQVPAPSAMIEREAIFLGTPASFESTVLLYDSRLLRRRVPGLKVSRYCFDVRYSAIEPILPSWPPPKPAQPRQAVANPGQWCKIGIEPPSWPLFAKPPEAGIIAQLLPGERSLLVLWCESGAWDAVEPHWLDLIAELQRFGLIEEPKPKRGGGSVPEKLEERARCVFEWEEARASQPGLSGDTFVASRKDVYATGSSLYRWRQDPEVQDYIERHYRSSAINEP